MIFGFLVYKLSLLSYYVLGFFCGTVWRYRIVLEVIKTTWTHYGVFLVFMAGLISFSTIALISLTSPKE